MEWEGHEQGDRYWGFDVTAQPNVPYITACSPEELEKAITLVQSGLFDKIEVASKSGQPGTSGELLYQVKSNLEAERSKLEGRLKFVESQMEHEKNQFNMEKFRQFAEDTQKKLDEVNAQLAMFSSEKSAGEERDFGE